LIHVGIKSCGTVDVCHHQHVESDFVIIGLPLGPTGSFFVGRGDIRHPIPWNFKSLFAGYYRFYGWIPAMIVWIVATPQGLGNAGQNNALLALSGVILLVWLAGWFLLESARGSGKRRRELFGKLTGFYTLPGVLSRELCRELFEKIRPTLDSLQITSDPGYWDTHVPEDDLAPFVYVMAEFRARIDNSRPWRTIARKYWQRVDRLLVSNSLRVAGD
jgi:hypothetical protein